MEEYTLNDLLNMPKGTELVDGFLDTSNTVRVWWYDDGVPFIQVKRMTHVNDMNQKVFNWIDIKYDKMWAEGKYYKPRQPVTFKEALKSQRCRVLNKYNYKIVYNENYGNSIHNLIKQYNRGDYLVPINVISVLSMCLSNKEFKEVMTEKVWLIEE